MSDQWLITADMVDLGAYFDFPGQFLPVTGSLSLRERFNNIRSNYRRHQAMVDAGLSSWFGDDPYELGDWLTVFTPIEFSLWQDIRGMGLDLWPQLPVGRFYADFGNPVAKVAVECDGMAYHQDKAKDQARDEQMEAMGWTVIRIPGYQCNGRIIDSEEAERKGVDRDEWNDQKTPHTSLLFAKECLDGPRISAGLVYRARLRARMERVRVASSQANGAGVSESVWDSAGEADGSGKGER